MVYLINEDDFHNDFAQVAVDFMILDHETQERVIETYLEIIGSRDRQYFFRAIYDEFVKADTLEEYNEEKALSPHYKDCFL